MMSYVRTEEHRKRMSDKIKALYRQGVYDSKSDEMRKWWEDHPEARIRMSKVHKGKVISEGQKKAM